MNKTTNTIKTANLLSKIFSAFSILELMFALVVISVVLAAFAPVISSRYSSEVATIFDGSEEITSSECDINFPNPYGLICTLCKFDSVCVTCGGNCPSGKVKNRAKCTCE